MQIVIEIPKDEYNKIINTHPNMCSFIEQQIKMGIVLPKGHGRLIDGDDALDRLDSGYDYDVIRYAPTVLEGNKED